jgi:polyhydroxyalkanoate synthesis regulator phasin
LLEAGMQFTALTRAEAQRQAERLVKEGQLAQERAQTFVDEMVESSRRRADALVDVVRNEFQRQVDALGLATKADLARLEAKLSGRAAPKPRKATKKRKAPARKSVAKKAKKAATRKGAKKRR